MILTQMVDELRRSPQIYHPSQFWQQLNSAHLQQLNTAGLDNFKRSINSKYFSWGTLGIIRHQLQPVISALMVGNFSPLQSQFKNYHLPELNRVRNFNFLSALIYRIYVAALADYIRPQDKLRLLDRLKEPIVGNPFIIRYRNRSISQDLCNSIHEFYSATSQIDLDRAIHLADLGAGYGRFGYVFLKALPQSSYCIIDIPPALFISQEYLARVFPQEQIFKFKPFRKFYQVKKEFEAARIKFLLPHQIELLPPKYFNLFINISSLHEMTKLQISHYLQQIDRLCRGYFYFKQWRQSRVPDNSFIRENDYPIPKRWTTVFHHRHPIQAMFFEALYRIN